MSGPLRLMEVDGEADAAKLRRLLARPEADLRRAERVAAAVVADVRRRGDVALARWARRFGDPAAKSVLDHPRAAKGAATNGSGRERSPRSREAQASWRVPQSELAEAWRSAPPALRRALRQAQRNLEQMARWQMPRPFLRTMAPGVRVGQQVRPLASVGCYVPGGRYPLPSTLLMTATPARVAGVKRIVAVCARPEPAVLAAAHLAGVTEFYALGGAHAIAALAYGTASLPRVEKIVGPGNVYVTAAKKLVSHDCAIDFLAGPTEVLVLAEPSANPVFVAADLLAQAEHDPQAAAWVATWSRRLAAAVNRELARQLVARPNPTALAALRAQGAILLARNREQAVALANRIAPEHLTVPAASLAAIASAGSIFVGEFAPQAVGDYLSGANHVLPTAGGARLRGGLSVLDFVKIQTMQELTQAGLRRLAPAILELARAEGLPGHAASVEVRL
ncbi:MAG TPA: histidinol dehydrogenase [Terriglobales bacterium]|nr:histidinol dehydrogenase [Terriglobales bacterium]